MTVADNVCAGVEVQATPRRAKNFAERYLGIFGLTDFVDRYPARLSGRPAAARGPRAHGGGALGHLYVRRAHEARSMPTLRARSRQNMLDLFDVCNRTVLYVSHDIDKRAACASASA